MVLLIFLYKMYVFQLCSEYNKEDLKFEGVGVVFVELIFIGFESVVDLEAFVFDFFFGQLQGGGQ